MQRAFGEHSVVTPRLTCDRVGVLQLQKLHAGYIFCIVQALQSPGVSLPTCVLIMSECNTAVILPLGCCCVIGGHTGIVEHY